MNEDDNHHLDFLSGLMDLSIQANEALSSVTETLFDSDVQSLTSQRLLMKSYSRLSGTMGKGRTL